MTKLSANSNPSLENQVLSYLQGQGYDLTKMSIQIKRQDDNSSKLQFIDTGNVVLTGTQITALQQMFPELVNQV